MAAASALFSPHADVVRQALLQFAAEGGGRVGDALAYRDYWKRNRTPLEAACERGDALVAKLLLSHGADPAAQVNAEPTALHLAVRATADAGTSLALLEALLSGRWEDAAGAPVEACAADPNATCTAAGDAPGTRVEEATPLYVAASVGNALAVERLLANGAAPRRASRLCLFGEAPVADRPLEVARRRATTGQHEVIRLLSRACAAGPTVVAFNTPPASMPLPAAASRATSSVLATVASPTTPAGDSLEEQLTQLSQLHWDDTFVVDGAPLTKKAALLDLVRRHPRRARVISLLARDLAPGETVLVPELDECAVGSLQLCLAALERDDADVTALRVLVSLSASEAVDMPHGCGRATAEQLCREIVAIEKRGGADRRFSKAAGAARLAAEKASAAAAERRAAAAAASAAVASAGDAKRAAARAAEVERAREEEGRAVEEVPPPMDAVTAVQRALRLGGVADKDVCAYASSLLASPAPGADPLHAAVDAFVLASLRRHTAAPMLEAAQLLRDALLTPDPPGAAVCKRACDAQTKFQHMFPPALDDAQPAATGGRTLRMGDVPASCRPFIALAHLLADARGTWAADAAAHLAAYGDPLPVQPSPVAVLALAVQAQRRNDVVAAGSLLYAFAHWGAKAGELPGAAAAGWLGPGLMALLVEGAERADGRQPEPPVAAGDGGAHADGPEAEWERQKLQQGRLPSSEQLHCPALDAIMTGFDGLRAVKEACLQLFVEVKQAGARARRTGTTLQQQLSDSPYHFVFLGNPGTGKTSIAKHVHELLVELKLRADKKQYVQIDNGQRLARDGPVKFRDEHVKKALNGTLFIDEAYQLVGSGSFGTGQAVLDDLLTVAENQRHEISIILSGYRREMEDMINGGNVGLASRFPRRLLFEDFDQPILYKLLQRHVASQKLTVRPGDEVGVAALAHRVARGCGKPGFANARTMRTQWGLVVQRMSARMEEEARREPHRRRSHEEDTQLHLSDLLGAPPEPDADPALLKLNAMIGLGSAKGALRRIATQLSENYREERGGGVPKPFSLNCIFAGNAGTGKTTAAELFSEFLVRCGLASGLTVVTPAKFMAETAGATRTALREILNAAALSGRVLFIDEAHTMFDVDDRGGGGGVPPLKEGSRAAFETLVSAIPGDGSSSFILILAGYTDLLRDMLAHPRVDQGLARRVPNWVDFDDFSNEELRFLVKHTAEGAAFKLRVDFQTADLVVRAKLAKLRARRGWGNAGTVRNAVVDAAGRLQARVAELVAPPERQRRTLTLSDFGVDPERALEGADSAVARAMEGLTNAEALALQLQGIADAAIAKLKEAGKEKGPKDSYLFLGPPGTGKTTVARRLGVLLCDLGTLESDHMHEVQGLSLLGSYLGQTKDKVKAAFDAALGGLLFIDEAYALFPTDIYKKEAVDAIVGYMTQAPYAGNMALVLAGYREEMDALLNSPSVNPGIRRRFAKTVLFQPWGVDVSNNFVVEQLRMKRKELTPEAAGALHTLVADMIARTAKQWGSAGHCIMMCDEVSGAAEARLAAFRRGAAERRRASRPDLLSSLEEQLEAAEAALYATGEGVPVLLVTREDVVGARPTLLPPPAVVQPVTMVVHAGPVASASDVVAAPPPPRLPLEAVPAEEELAPADAEEVAAPVGDTEQMLIAASALAGGDSAAALRALEAWAGGAFPPSLLAAGDTPAVRAALVQHCTAALAIVRAQVEAQAAEERRLAELKAAAEAAAKARDEAKAKAAREALAAAQAAARREQQAQAALRSMGVCEAGFCWIRVGGGYRCAGGSHFVSDGRLGL